MTRMNEKDVLVENVLLLGDRAFRELFPMLPKEWLHVDLTTQQLKVVLLLFLNGPSRMTDIASALAVSLATATGVVDRLVEREMVIRDSQPEDRRVVLCRLSDKGEEMISRLWQLARSRASDLLKAMVPEQLSLVSDALEALLQAGETTRVDLPES